MSGSCSIPFLKIPTSSSSPSTSSSSSSSSSSSFHSSIRFSSSRPFLFTIRSSQTEGPLRRPSAPSLREPSPPPPLKPSSPPPQTAAPVSQPLKQGFGGIEDNNNNVITLEFQRLKAKELQEYFKQKKLDEADQGPFFGFIGKNEISNGRWAMFGFAVGMLTEYATGSNFVDQVKILLSNFGIVDID